MAVPHRFRRLLIGLQNTNNIKELPTAGTWFESVSETLSLWQMIQEKKVLMPKESASSLTSRPIREEKGKKRKKVAGLQPAAAVLPAQKEKAALKEEAHLHAAAREEVRHPAVLHPAGARAPRPEGAAPEVNDHEQAIHADSLF
jgi:hypothetical protein